MKREEEYQKAAHEYINSDAVKPENMQMAYGDFINGAKWADEHPKNPWVSVDERLPEEGMSVVARNYYEGKGYNHCVCVFQGGKIVVVVTNLTTGETQEIENNYVKAWMPIPSVEGGEK